MRDRGNSSTGTGRRWQAKSRIGVLALAFGLGALLAVPAARTNAPGDVLYAPAPPMEFLSYARTVRLQHPAVHGTLLATFEHRHRNFAPAPFLIEKSADDGRTWRPLARVADGEIGPGHPWPNFFQPHFFELPVALGKYPAGTLLLAGNVCPADVSQTHLQLWRSADHGAHWQALGAFQKGGGFGEGRGIWEPFLALDRRGDLVCFFSDERRSAAHSQILAHLVSHDGGDTWGDEVVDVTGPDRADRPGMATVARVPGGRYAMAYEVCGPHACEVHVRTSPDGDDWGDPADLGPRPQTGDGRYLANTPYLAWAPAGGPHGRLLLAACAEKRADGGAPAPESGQVVFTDVHGGAGPWSWMPAPFHPVTDPPGDTQANYSPCLLPSPDGAALRLSTASGGTPGQIRTQTAAAGLLPYAAPFGAGTDAGWIDYGGAWSVQGGALWVAADGDGDKAVAGATNWTDYALAAGVALMTPGRAGLLVRVSDPDIGANALGGYYIGLDTADGSLFVGRADGEWATLAQARLPGGIATGAWFHITVRVRGSDLTATARPAVGTGTPVTLRVSDTHFPAGAIGVRADHALAAWRNVEARPIAPRSVPPSAANKQGRVAAAEASANRGNFLNEGTINVTVVYGRGNIHALLPKR